MIACVSAVVRVMWQATCGVVIAAVMRRERLGRLVAGLAFEAVPVDGPAVEARGRARLQPAQPKAGARQRLRKPEARRLAMAAGRGGLLAEMDQPVQERAGGEHDRGGGDLAAILQPHARDPATCATIRSAASPSTTARRGRAAISACMAAR